MLSVTRTLLVSLLLAAPFLPGCGSGGGDSSTFISGSSSTGTVSKGGPVLSVSDCSASTSAIRPLGIFTVGATLRNTGDESASSVQIGLDITPLPAPFRITTFPNIVGDLAPGQSVDVSWMVEALPEAGGSYTISPMASAIAGGSLIQGSCTVAGTVTVPPVSRSLEVTAVTAASPMARPGDFVTVSGFVLNSGNVPAIWTMPVPSAAPDVLRDFEFLETPRTPLPPGETGTFVIRARVDPATPVGTRVVVDISAAARMGGAEVTDPGADSPARIDIVAAAKAARSALSGPRACALDTSGRLFVSDTGNGRVLLYDPAGSPAPSRVLDGHSSPGGLAVADGKLYVADTGNDRVLVYDGLDASPRTVGGLSAPAAVAVEGQTLAVADTGNNRVLLYDLLDLSSPARTLAGLSSPTGVALCGGRLIVSDTGTSRVLVYASAAAEAPEAVLGGLALPRGISASGEKLFVADTGNDRVLVFGPLGFLPLAGARALDVLDSGLAGPVGVFGSGDGSAWIADTGNDRVVKR